MTLILESDTAVAHAWWWRTEGSSPEPADLALLSKDERERAAKIVHAPTAVGFVAGRAASRRILSGLLDVAPAEIGLGRRPCPGCGDPLHGPPAVLSPESPLWISISHTHGCGMLAVARVPVGVDVEGVRDFPVEELAPATLTESERQVVLGADEGSARTRAFLRSWTRKEAVLKAVGVGITTDLRTVETRPEHAGPVVVAAGVPGTPASWTVADLAVPGAWAAALSVPARPEGGHLEVRLREHP
ncbi:4'-phosphopantetheinyl transferase superfamily protein [Streptomyces sp. NBC_00083]|uniref:4'-phosphopantetheinyl transferase family protein n=1 Tax=Streptomyces sp. NBC_00083 TaxID=2975647 RepID=UPI0022598E2F|nr:4'-phosphopantetheinyl transferase superfamily protein [Streptomyces sp. NBC_00083]MCX5386328.1 4'-phosphopantetheinyl transferase superfamily protein [Streptomyces sp. NBC_00083]